MKECLSGELRDTSHPALRQHLVRHRRVCDVGHTLTEARCQILFRPDLVDLLGDIVRQNGAQVAGMVPVTAAFQDITHILVHVIDSSYDRDDKPAARHNDVHILKRNAFGGHKILDGLMTHIRLIHYGRVFGDILGGVLKLGVKDPDTI